MPSQVLTEIRVVVHYVAAEQPYRAVASPSDTVGQLKSKVLDAFGLSEGQTPDGNTATYTLFDGKTPLEDPAVTLGQLAGHQHVLQLKLVQQVVQGATT